MRSDTEIQQAVQRELEWDSRVDHTQTGVTVRSGIVGAARGTAGVRSVHDELRVQP
jgi:osmotically-inducible protein OsmY